MFLSCTTISSRDETICVYGKTKNSLGGFYEGKNV